MKPIKGMFTDAEPYNAPEGFYKVAKNMCLNPFTNTIINEPGNSKLSDNLLGKEIGSIKSGEDYIVIFSIVDYKIHIGIQTGSNYKKVLDYIYASYPGDISGTCFKNEDGDRYVCFTDERNKPKIVNLDRKYTDTVNIEDLFLFPNANIPEIEDLEVLDSGGQLESGMYSFTIAYVSKDKSITDYFIISNPVPITDGTYNTVFNKYDGCPAGSFTGKAIKFKVTKVDSRYEAIRIAVVKYIKGQTVVDEVGDYPISSDEIDIVYNGQNLAPLDILDVTVKSAKYDSVKDILYHNKKLWLLGLTREDRYDIQADANDIVIKWVAEETVALNDIKGSHKDGATVFFKKSFMPDEVYAFYIHWVLNDGTILEGFHIPGREVRMLQIENLYFKENKNITEIFNANPDDFSYLIEDTLIDTDIKWFHTRDTARSDGTMGYWENTNKYPEGFPQLSDKNIRHHKFPSLKELGDWGKPITKNVIAIEDFGEIAGEFEFSGTGLHFKNIVYNNVNNYYYSLDAQNLKIDFLFSGTITVDINLMLTGEFNQGQTEDYISLIVVNEFGNLVEDIGGGVNNNSMSLIVNKKFTVTPGTSIYISYRIDEGTPIVEWGSSFEFGFSFDSLKGILKGHVLGIELTSVNIPSKLQGKVQGYTISYAKRKHNNSRVIAQGCIFEKSHSSYLHPLIDDFVFHGADLFVNGDMPGISPKFLRLNYILTGDKYNKEQTYSINNDKSKTIRAIKNGIYESQKVTFPKTESRFEGKLRSRLNLVGNGHLAHTTFITAIKDAYFDFEHQELVSIGKIFRFTEPQDNHVTYSGDVYLNNYGMRRMPTPFEKINNKIVFTNTTYSYLIYSVNNIGLRHEGTAHYEKYYPKHNIPDDFEYEEFENKLVPDPNDFDNYLMVNSDYRKLNDLNILIPYQRNLITITKYPYRIASSIVATTENIVSGIKRFLPFAYYDMPADRGKAIAINSIGHELLIHMSKSLYKTVESTTLKTTEAEIVLGSNEIFEIAPREMVMSDDSYLGLLDKNATILTPFGYMFCDREKKVIFKIGEGPEEISSIGMQEVFNKILESTLNKQIKENEHTHEIRLLHYPNTSFTYDAKYKRIFFIMYDVGFNDPDLYKGSLINIISSENYINVQESYEEGDYYDSNGLLYKVVVRFPYSSLLQLADFDLTDFNITPKIISYSPLTQGWSSFHTWQPGMLYSNNNKLYSIENQEFWEHNTKEATIFYEVPLDSFIDIILNDDPGIQKKYASVGWKTLDITNDKTPSQGYDKLMVYNSNQCSGVLDIDARFINGFWRFNNFFDKSNTFPFLDENYELIEGSIEDLEWWKQKKFTDRMLILRLIINSNNQKTIHLQEAISNYRQSLRQ